MVAVVPAPGWLVPVGPGFVPVGPGFGQAVLAAHAVGTRYAPRGTAADVSD